jgi:hypothetical protein
MERERFPLIAFQRPRRAILNNKIRLDNLLTRNRKMDLLQKQSQEASRLMLKRTSYLKQKQNTCVTLHRPKLLTSHPPLKARVELRSPLEQQPLRILRL